MAILKTFCCCFRVKGGSGFTGVYSMITSTIFMCLLVVRYIGDEVQEYFEEDYALSIYVTISFCTLQLLSAVVLLVGVVLDNKFFVLPWIVTTIACILEGSGVMCWILVRDMQRAGEVPTWEAALTAYQLCNSIILVYCLLCVISYVQDLIAGKGRTRDYHRRRHRRQEGSRGGRGARGRRRRRNRNILNAYLHTYVPNYIEINPEAVLSPDRPPQAPVDTPILTPPPYTSDRPPPYHPPSYASVQRQARTGDSILRIPSFQNRSNHVRGDVENVIPTVSERCESNNVSDEGQIVRQSSNSVSWNSALTRELHRVSGIVVADTEDELSDSNSIISIHSSSSISSVPCQRSSSEANTRVESAVKDSRDSSLSHVNRGYNSDNEDGQITKSLEINHKMSITTTKHIPLSLSKNDNDIATTVVELERNSSKICKLNDGSCSSSRNTLSVELELPGVKPETNSEVNISSMQNKAVLPHIKFFEGLSSASNLNQDTKM